MKKYLILTALFASILLTACTNDVPNGYIDTAPETEAETYAPTEPLWDCDSCYLTAEDDGYALYSRFPQSEKAIRSFCEYHTVTCHGKGGEITHHLVVEEADDGTRALYKLGEDGNLYLEAQINESVAFFGDWFVVDGILHSPQLRVHGRVEGESIPESPRYDEVITFDNARCYLANETTLLHGSDKTEYIRFTDTYNGEKVGLYRDGDKYLARCFSPDLGAAYGGMTYVRETELLVEYYGDYGGYDVYKAGEVSYVIDKSSGILLEGIGAFYKLSGGYIGFYPFDLTAPLTLYNPDFSVFLDGVLNFAMLDEAMLVCLLPDYRGEMANYDDSYHLASVSPSGEVTHYGTYDGLLYFSETYGRDGRKYACALLENDGICTLTESDGREIFSIDRGYTVDYLAMTHGDGTTPDVMRFIFCDNATRDKDGNTKYIEYAFDTVTGTYEVSEYYNFPNTYIFGVRP